MTHIIFASYANKGTHEKLVSELNNWRYEHKGENRIGLAAPLVSEIKFYDVRLPEQCVPEFMRDMGFKFNDNDYGKQDYAQGRVLKWGNRALNVMRKIVGLRTVKPAEGDKRYQLKASWCNNFLIGVMTDDIRQDDITGKKKEVL